MPMDYQRFPPGVVTEIARFLARLHIGEREKAAALISAAFGQYVPPAAGSNDPLTQYQLEAEKGVANGYASLDASGIVPLSQLPPDFGGANQGTNLVSGGQVTWQSGLTFLVAAGTGYIDGTLVTWTQQTVTLDAADPTDPRIDVIYIGTDGTADSLTGTPSADPSEPVTDPATQLKLVLVTVGAGATEPDVTSELVYAENAGSPTEWDWTTSGSGWNVASTAFPFGGTISIEGAAVDENAYAQGERDGGTIDPGDFTQLVLYLQVSSAWGSGRYIQVTLRAAGVQIGNSLRIAPGFFGIDGDNTFSYQAVIIPMVQFAAPAGSAVDQLRFQAIGGTGDAINAFIDGVAFTTGGAIGGGTGDGMTQAEADARYAQRANNLSDLSSAAAARTNLGLNQLTIQEIDGSPAELEPVTLEFPNGTLTEPSAGVVRYTPAVSVDADEKVKVSANDTTAGYLNGKLVAGSGITLTENNDGGNETLTIDVDAIVAGRYRAWTYTTFSAGEFTYVVDGSGNPVYGLMDLE